MLSSVVYPFQGVNVCSDIVLQQPKLVTKAVNSQLVVFTWGQLNNEYANILSQRRMGVHAIIYDRYGRVVKSVTLIHALLSRITSLIAPQKNVFADEVDAEEEEEEVEGTETDIKFSHTT